MTATRRGCLPLLGVLLLTALPAARAAQERTGPDSFLRHRVYTVNALVAEVESDATARQRLAKHFHMSQAELVSYLRSNLKVVTFSESGWRPVYGVTSTGRIYRARDYFHRGGKVFGLADGTPVLKYACGNPLIPKLPAAAPEKVSRAPERLEIPTHAPEEYALVVGLPVAPTFEIPGAAPFEVPKEYPMVAAIPAAEAFTVPVATAVTRAAPVPLWPLGFGFIPFLEHHHNRPPVPPPIPEPASMLLLGSGAALLAALRLRRRR